MRYKGIKGKCWDEIKRIVRGREKDCFTCGKPDLQGIDAQAGHYLPVGYVGSNNTLSWDLKQIHLQCSRCNGAGQGMQVLYKTRLIALYGRIEVSQLEKRAKKTDPVKDWKVLLEELKGVV